MHSGIGQIARARAARTHRSPKATIAERLHNANDVTRLHRNRRWRHGHRITKAVCRIFHNGAGRKWRIGRARRLITKAKCIENDQFVAGHVRVVHQHHTLSETQTRRLDAEYRVVAWRNGAGTAAVLAHVVQRNDREIVDPRQILQPHRKQEVDFGIVLRNRIAECAKVERVGHRRHVDSKRRVGLKERVRGKHAHVVLGRHNTAAIVGGVVQRHILARTTCEHERRDVKQRNGKCLRQNERTKIALLDHVLDAQRKERVGHKLWHCCTDNHRSPSVPKGGAIACHRLTAARIRGIGAQHTVDSEQLDVEGADGHRLSLARTALFEAQHNISVGLPTTARARNVSVTCVCARGPIGRTRVAPHAPGQRGRSTNRPRCRGSRPAAAPLSRRLPCR